MEFGELIEIVIVDSVASLDRVEFLTSRSKVEALFIDLSAWEVQKVDKFAL
jgi:hypothetical protein